MRIATFIFFLAVLAGTAEAKILTEVIEYRHGDVVLEGYLAYDDALDGKRPGVLVVHEWWGINPYIKNRVEQLAGLGFVAFAADIYGKGIRPGSTEEASRVAGSYRSDRMLLRQRARAGLDVLNSYPLVDVKRTAAVGYCFGGTTVLEIARSSAQISGVVSFHGGLSTPAPASPNSVNTRVLVLHGGNDPFVPDREVVAFTEEMRKSGADWQIVSYGGAVHSFTNPASGNDPSKGLAYSEAADRRSWEAMQAFFREIFR